MFKLRLILFTLIFASLHCAAQSDIFEMMERSDKSLAEVEAWAEEYFKLKGTERGSGYKQYQRWLYERRFHLDATGNYINPQIEFDRYKKFKSTINSGLRSGNTWQELGPKSFNYTSSWNPGVGRITSIAIHPSDTQIIYVSSPGGGLWKSSNGGVSWIPLIDNVNAAWMSVFHLSIDPNNPNIIYASVINGGVIKSINAGMTWSATGSGPNNAKQVKVYARNSNIVFCAANNGIWRSANAGTTWVNVQNETKEDIEFNPADTNVMYASGSSGTSCVWRSNDLGVSWTPISAANGINYSGRTLLAVSPDSPAIVYAVQANGSSFGRMYKSVDSGKTYITTVVGNPANKTNFFGYSTDGSGSGGQANYDMAICVNPRNASEVHIAGIICFKSEDGGYTFTATTAWSYPNGTGYNHADVHVLEWINYSIYSGSDGGIYKSIDNANNFTDLSTGLGIKQYYRINCSKTDPNVITGGAQDNGSTYRRSNGTWVDWLGADGMDNAISPTNPDIAIGTSQNGSIYKTTNKGASYTNLPKPSAGNWVTPIVMHPTNHDTIYGGWTGVWRSDNGGLKFDSISPKSFGTIDVLAVAPSNPQYIYAAKGSNLYRTNNGGISWSTVATLSSITSIFVSRKDPAKIWITCNSTNYRVFVSTNQGTNFTNLSNGLPALNARCVVVDEDSIETVYVGMNIDVYYRDTSNTWKQTATGLPLVAINDLEIQKSSNKLRVATYGRGVWECNLQNILFNCPKPNGLYTSMISTDSALLSWKGALGVLSYQVEYKKATDTIWNILNTSLTDTFVSVKSLLDSTAYMWRVKSNCSNIVSGWDSASFITNKYCGMAQGLIVQNTNFSSASLAWNNISGANEYAVGYKLTTDLIWTYLPNTTNNYITINGLTAGNYNWKVSSICGSSVAPSAVSSFVIAPSCKQPDSLWTTQLTNGDMMLYWSPVSNANAYIIDYKLNSSSIWINTTNSVLPYLKLSYLTAGIYDWRVKADCSSSQSLYAVSQFARKSILQVANNKEDKYKVLLFPNPAKEYVIVQYNLYTKEKKVELTIYNVLGEMVFHKTIEGNKGINEEKIDLNALSNGQYTLTVGIDGLKELKSFVLMK